MNPSHTTDTYAERELLVEISRPAEDCYIKVVGVGGGGDNAVAHMYRTGSIPGVSFVACNTDRKALDDSPIPEKLQLGPGLGAGGRPEQGRELAEANIGAIHHMLDREKTRMVFVTAGMGGGTGTGAAPVIAREARKRGLLTVGIVTLPFLFEHEKQIRKAFAGLDEMQKNVDALIVIVNEKLREIYHDLSVANAFKKADDILNIAVRSIMDIINMRGRVLLDFRDVDMVLRRCGIAVMSTGYGTGENRLTMAIEQALYSPLLNNHNYFAARRLIMKISSGEKPEEQLMMHEIDEVNAFMSHFGPGIETKYGINTESQLGDRLKVTILAGGFDEQEDSSQADEMVFDMEKIRRYYGNIGGDRRPHVNAFIYDLDNLDDEETVALVDGSPTARRTRYNLEEIRSRRSH